MSNSAPGYTSYPDHRVVAAQPPRHVRVLVNDTVIADSRAAILVEESRHDPVWYFPPNDVVEQSLQPSDRSSYCPFKGHASYWSIVTPGATLDDAVWAYLTPYDEFRALAGYYAFYRDRVRLEVAGEA
ncbi:MAG: DUF427 domain-containing protein [Pseudomonadales bacterium]